MKKTVLYIIDSLERGGAEVMLVSSLKEIHREFTIIVVTLSPQNSFAGDELNCDKIFCLNMRGKADLFFAVKRLQKIITDSKAAIVHATLFWSVLVARLACGKRTNLVFSLATIMSSGIYKHKWYSGYTKLLDRLTYKKYQVVIAPTREVLLDFNAAIGIKGRSKLLYNFVNEEFFLNEIDYKIPSDNLRLVAVGNLKDVKNYQLLIDAFKKLKNYPVSIDIFGEGPDRDYLQQQIDANGLAVHLRGLHQNIHEVLPDYDGFVMCSIIEGFGIAAAEAMAIGLPLLLSDIKTLREISQDNALYFDPYKSESFVKVIEAITDRKADLKMLSENGKRISRENYTKEKYVAGLTELYNEILNEEPAL